MSHICGNCLAETDELFRVGGYRVCSECEAQAYLPAYLRGLD